MNRGRTAMWWKASLTATALLVITACHTPDRSDFPRIVNEPASLAGSVRANLGVIGVLPVATATNVYLYSPKDRGRAFGMVADKTWDGMSKFVKWRRGLDGDDLAANGATIGLITLVSLTAGAVGAAIGGVPAEQFQTCSNNLIEALREQPIDAGIQRLLARSLTRRSATNVSMLIESALGNVRLRGESKDFSAFGAQGIDSIMDIRLSQVGFELESGLNPELAFAPEVTVEVIRVSDGAVLQSSYLDYRGTKRSFTAWADNHAKAFRAEMLHAEREFADSIVQQYFSSEPMSPH